MAENAILTSRDKEILRGEVAPDDFSDFDNRLSKIRTRVRKRGEVLVREIDLLYANGEREVADEFVKFISSEIDGLGESEIRDQLYRIKRDLEEIEQKNAEIPLLKTRISEIERALDQ